MSDEELFNPWTLPRPDIREDEREYTDSHHPGIKVKIRFRELNPFLEGQALRLYGEYYRKFVVPEKKGNGKEPSPQVLPTPIPVLLNEIILDDLVLLQAMQVPGKSGKKYGIIEWAGYAVNMPDAFREMVRVCKELNQPLKEPDEGNLEAEESSNSSATESSSQLSSIDNPIPTGCSTSPGVSGASPEPSSPSPNGFEFPQESAERTQDNLTTASSVTTSG